MKKENLFHKKILESNFNFDKKNSFDDLKLLNLVYLENLKTTNIVSHEEYTKIYNGLKRIHADDLVFDPEKEDLILHLEKKLIEIVGPAGGKLHTGRSRNDMGHTLLRMNLRRYTKQIQLQIVHLCKALLEVAETSKQVTFPAITHGQYAQIIPFAHILLGVTNVFLRDLERFSQAYARINLCPMGAAALAGTSWPLDREKLAKDLGFFAPLINSYDCVSSVDCTLEFVNTLEVHSVNISRLLYELNLGVMQEMKWFSFGTEFVNISSIMPQKRNPIVLEHLRGRFSVIIGRLSFATMLAHNTPYGDTNDIELEMKMPLGEAITDFLAYSMLLCQVVSTMTINEKKLTASNDFLKLAELADWLVRKYSISFREAHKISSTLMDLLVQEGKTLQQLDQNHLSLIWKKIIQEERSFNIHEINSVLDTNKIIESRKTLGGTSAEQIEKQLVTIKMQLKNYELELTKNVDNL